MSYNTEEEGGNTRWFGERTYKTIDEQFAGEDWERIRYDFDAFYEKYRKIQLNKIMKTAGAVTGLGLSLIALITTLALTLKKRVMI